MSEIHCKNFAPDKNGGNDHRRLTTHKTMKQSHEEIRKKDEQADNERTDRLSEVIRNREGGGEASCKDKKMTDKVRF